LDAGAEDAIESDGELQVYTDPKELAKVRDAIKAAGLEVTEAELTYVPNNTIEITDAAVAQKIMNLIDALDELTDVVATHTNFDIAEGLEV
jgi:transcriptional/translational regulatory protein YebC/TACO1